MAGRTNLPMAQQGSTEDPSMFDATRRIHELIDDADRQAGQIIMNAEVEARRYVQAVRQKTDEEAEQYAKAMASLSEALISQAEALSRESQRLLANLDTYQGHPVVDDLVSAVGADEIELREPKPNLAPVERPVVPAFPDMPADPEVGLTQDFSAGARLLATQMAVAGSTRADIRDRLTNDFGIADPEPLLDSILGTS